MNREAQTAAPAASLSLTTAPIEPSGGLNTSANTSTTILSAAAASSASAFTSSQAAGAASSAAAGSTNEGATQNEYDTVKKIVIDTIVDTCVDASHAALLFSVSHSHEVDSEDVRQDMVATCAAAIQTKLRPPVQRIYSYYAGSWVMCRPVYARFECTIRRTEHCYGYTEDLLMDPFDFQALCAAEKRKNFIIHGEIAGVYTVRLVRHMDGDGSELLIMLMSQTWTKDSTPAWARWVAQSMRGHPLM